MAAIRITPADIAGSIRREGDLWKWAGHIRLNPAQVPDDLAQLITETNELVDRLYGVLGRIAQACGYDEDEEN